MKRIPLLIFVLFCCVYAPAQTLDKAIEYFKTNNRAKALESLHGITAENEKPYALLVESILQTDNGNYPEAFRLFKKFYESQKDPYAYVYAFATSGLFTGQGVAGNSDMKDFFMDIIKDPKADLSIRSFAQEQVARYYRYHNDLDESLKYFGQVGDVKNWSTVGVFENTSGSGFNKDFGVLAHPEQDYKFTNKTGAEVNWFPMGMARNDRWWDFEYHYDISEAIIYAQTFIASDADMDVNLMIGVSGSMKVWLNDMLVGSESEERNTDNDVYAYRVKLQKGNNRLLLQVGSGELSNNNFMVRIASPDNQLLSLNSSDTYQPYAKAQPYAVKQLPFYPEAFFEQKVQANPDNLLDQLMLLMVYNHNDKRHEARKVAMQLKKMAPVCTIVSEAIIDALNRDFNAIDVTKEYASIKANDPECLFALILKYNEAEEKEEWDEAMKLLRRRIELYGENTETETKMIALLVKKNESERAVERINTDYSRYPDDESFVALRYLIVLNSSKDIRKANDVLKNFLRHRYDEKLMEQLCENYFKSGDRSAGIKAYKQLIENDAYGTNRYATFASTLFELNEKEQALEWVQKAIDRAPFVGGFYYQKGLVYDALQDTAQARDMMRKAIYYAPTNYDARKRLRQMEGKKDLFSYFKENDIDKLYKEAQGREEYKEKDVVFLLQDQDQVVHPENGAVEEKHELLLQVLTQKGINEYKEVDIPYNAYTQRLILEKAEILKRDGSKVTADARDNYLVFSSLEKGDGIHIQYRLENSYHGKLAEHFWEEVFLNGSYPVGTARYSLIVPANKKFSYKVYNTDLKPVETTIDNNYKLYVWEKNNITGINPEPMMPPASDIAERIVVTSIPDWNYVANWYSDLSSNRVKVDFEVREKVKELLDGKQNLAALEKAKLIYEFIEQNFNYSNVPFLHSAFVPQRASRTLSAKLGDCKDLATLFVAMAKEAGLDANLVLVDTRDNGVQNLDLPTINFNHCIAQLHVDNKDYLVELTNNHLPFGALTSYILKANGLYIPREGTVAKNASLVRLSSDQAANGIIRSSQVNFNGLHANLHRVSARIGAEAAMTRAAYKDVTEENRLKELSSTLSGEFNRNVKIDYLKLNNQDNLNDTMVFDYNFSVDNFSSEIAGMHVFKMPWTDLISAQEIVALEKRTLPVDIWSLYASQYMKETLEVNIPAGKKLLEMPKSVSISCPAISYNLKYEMKNNKLIATREVKYLKDRVMPEEYPAFKNFINQMNEADTKQLAIK